MSHHFLLIVHLFCATIWIGGHVYAAVLILPKVLKSGDPKAILDFEKNYEPMGMPSLLLLIVTGIWMMYHYGVRIQDLFSFKTPIESAISLKMLFLLSTVLLAISAQTRVIPQVKKHGKKLPEMAVHVALVTLLGIALLVVGTFVGRGGI